MADLNLLACRDKIEEAFKSLIQSGRPDIRDEENNDLIPKLYVDLFENDYILKQALDENHVIFKGRKGTGKSTVFLQAENILKRNKNKFEYSCAVGSSAIIRYYCYIPCTSTLLQATACHIFHTLYVLSFLICY